MMKKRRLCVCVRINHARWLLSSEQKQAVSKVEVSAQIESKREERTMVARERTFCPLASTKAKLFSSSLVRCCCCCNTRSTMEASTSLTSADAFEAATHTHIGLSLVYRAHWLGEFAWKLGEFAHLTCAQIALLFMLENVLSSSILQLELIFNQPTTNSTQTRTQTDNRHNQVWCNF